MLMFLFYIRGSFPRLNGGNLEERWNSHRCRNPPPTAFWWQRLFVRGTHWLSQGHLLNDWWVSVSRISLIMKSSASFPESSINVLFCRWVGYNMKTTASKMKKAGSAQRENICLVPGSLSSPTGMRHPADTNQQAGNSMSILPGEAE